MYINAAVGKDALFAVDVADAGGGGNHSLKAFWSVRSG
jgi:hypothetical protein